MYIIIVGGGRVGYYLARALLAEGHEALVIESEARVCQGITEELGSVCLRGDGCEVSTLIEAGTERADMLIAVTGDDEDNLVACQVAKHKFKVPRTISRIKNPRHENLFKRLGVDVTVSATNIILENIESEVPTHPLTHLLTLADKGLEIVDVKIPAGSSTIGASLHTIALPPGTVLLLVIRRGGKPFVPEVDSIIQAGDQVLAVTPSDSEETLRIALRGA
jgi:trk system potassium uptake protein